jgi:REP element-mobilizing transposase RayT
MPRPGSRWRHVVISTHCSWLPGDPRGFRSKDHDIHSSGDYKKPPPKGQHAGLHRYAKRHSADAVTLPQHLREPVGKAILQELTKHQARILALAVAGMHVHMLIELPDDMTEIRRIIGRCKTAACRAVRRQMPGRLWANYGSYKPVDDPEYQHKVYQYILRQRGAWIWSFKDGEIPTPVGAGLKKTHGMPDADRRRDFKTP